jgi:hypothetical protein
MQSNEEFEEIGARMLNEWDQGVSGLRSERVYSLAEWSKGAAFEGFADPPKLKSPKTVIGRSEGLGTNRKKTRVKRQ